MLMSFRLKKKYQLNIKNIETLQTMDQLLKKKTQLFLNLKLYSCNFGKQQINVLQTELLKQIIYVLKKCTPYLHQRAKTPCSKELFQEE